MISDSVIGFSFSSELGGEDLEPPNLNDLLSSPSNRREPEDEALLKNLPFSARLHTPHRQDYPS